MQTATIIVLTLVAVAGEGLVFERLYRAGRITKGPLVIGSGVAGALTAVLGNGLAWRSSGISDAGAWRIMGAGGLVAGIGMPIVMFWMYLLLKAQEEKKELDRRQGQVSTAPGEQPVRWFHVVIGVALLAIFTLFLVWRGRS